MSTLGHYMQDQAEAMDVTLQSSEGVYSLEMPTPGGRTQIVNATLHESGLGGEMVLFHTLVGALTDDVDCRSLLELNVGTIYARVGIMDEHIVVVAGQLLDSAEVSEVITMLSEVGTLGDLLEQLLYGADKY